MNTLENCTNCNTCGNCQQRESVDTPILFCMHCQPSTAPCLKACSNNAIELLGGAITLNKDKCIECMSCTNVCPINMIKI